MPATRVSATQASRAFSEVLDAIEKGRSFLVHRRGRPVCVMAPAPITKRRASECLEALRVRSPILLDDRFGDDLVDVLAAEAVEERPSWGS